MPLYSTKCEQCYEAGNRKLSFEEYDRVKEGALKLACQCGGTVQLVFDPAGVDFVLKDGESGGWISKAAKENAYRSNRRQVMARREKDHVRSSRLQPNFQGELAPSWKEAKGAAFQSTYDRVKGEHGVHAAAEAATESAKTYDHHVKREEGL